MLAVVPLPITPNLVNHRFYMTFLLWLLRLKFKPAAPLNDSLSSRPDLAVDFTVIAYLQMTNELHTITRWVIYLMLWKSIYSLFSVKLVTHRFSLNLSPFFTGYYYPKKNSSIITRTCAGQEVDVRHTSALWWRSEWDQTPCPLTLDISATATTVMWR